MSNQQTYVSLNNALKIIQADAQYVTHCQQTHNPVFNHTFVLYSLPGIGKTEGIRHMVGDPDHLAVIDLNAEFGGSLSMPIQHVDTIDDQTTAHVLHALNETIRALVERALKAPTEIFYLFLDEINRGDAFMKQTIMALLLEHRLPGHSLPNNVFVIGAGNTATNVFTDDDIQNDVQSFDTAIRDRINPLFIKLNVNDWLDYAYANGVSAEIIQFIEQASNQTDTLYHTSLGDDDTGSTPRSWTRLTGILSNRLIRQNAGLLRPAIASQIGEELTTQFMNFLKLNDSMDILSILKTTQLTDFDNDQKFGHEKRQAFMLLAPRYLEREPSLVKNFAELLRTKDQIALNRFVKIMIQRHTLTQQFPVTYEHLLRTDAYVDLINASSANNL